MDKDAISSTEEFSDGAPPAEEGTQEAVRGRQPTAGVTAETLQAASTGSWHELRDRLFSTLLYARTDDWIGRKFKKQGHILFEGEHVLTIDDDYIKISDADVEDENLRIALPSTKIFNLPTDSDEWLEEKALFVRGLRRILLNAGLTKVAFAAFAEEDITLQDERVGTIYSGQLHLLPKDKDRLKDLGEEELPPSIDLPNKKTIDAAEWPAAKSQFLEELDSLLNQQGYNAQDHNEIIASALQVIDDRAQRHDNNVVLDEQEVARVHGQHLLIWPLGQEEGNERTHSIAIPQKGSSKFINEAQWEKARQTYLDEVEVAFIELEFDDVQIAEALAQAAQICDLDRDVPQYRDIGTFFVPFSNKRVFSAAHREREIEQSRHDHENLHYVTMFENHNHTVIRQANFFQNIHDKFLIGLLRGMQQVLGKETASKIPFFGRFFLDEATLEQETRDKLAEGNNNTDYELTADQNLQSKAGRRPKMPETVTSKLSESLRERGMLDPGKTANADQDEITRRVEKYTFNQTEGNARGFGEQLFRVSAPFAVMTSATVLSRNFFKKGTSLVRSFTNLFDKEKREEQAKEIEDKGGISKVLKDEMIKFGGSSVKHFFRDHLADWHVGVFYVYAKEEFMRANGPLDHPDKYAHVMRRAFTIYNMYIELVHNAGYDFVEDMIFNDGQKEQLGLGTSKGKFNLYRERHRPENYERLNGIQKGWNFMLDGMGFLFERGTQVFTHMQAATTFFGANRFHGIDKAGELHKLHSMGFSLDDPKRGPYYEAKPNANGVVTEEAREHANRMNAEYLRAKFLMNRSSVRYRTMQRSGVDWPIITELLDDETRYVPVFSNRDLDGTNRIEFNEKGEPRDSEGNWFYTPEGRPYLRKKPPQQCTAKELEHTVTDLEIVKRYSTALAPEGNLSRAEFSSFNKMAGLITSTIEKDNQMVQEGKSKGLFDAANIFNKSMTAFSGKDYKEEGSREKDAFKIAMNWQSAYAGYGPYSAAKKFFGPLAEDSETIGIVTGSGTSILDKLKFGSYTGEDKGKNKSFGRLLMDVVTSPWRALRNLAGGNSDPAATRLVSPSADESLIRSHRSQLQVDTGETRVIGADNRMIRTANEVVNQRFDELERNDISRLARIEKQLAQLDHKMMEMRSTPNPYSRENQSAMASFMTEMQNLSEQREQLIESSGSADMAYRVMPGDPSIQN